MNDGPEVLRSYHALVRTDIFPLVPRKGGKLLDVGGGIGATAVALKEKGFIESAGVIDLVSQDAESLGLDFHCSGDLDRDDTLKQVISNEGPFDVILCLDILEHISDPWEMIKSLHAALTPDGVIIASIPNIRHYTASFPLFFLGEWKLKDSGVLDRTHVRWFVRDTAIQLMTCSGLKLEEVVEKPSGRTKIRILRLLTFGILKSFTNLQYLIRVKNC